MLGAGAGLVTVAGGFGEDAALTMVFLGCGASLILDWKGARSRGNRKRSRRTVPVSVGEKTTTVRLEYAAYVSRETFLGALWRKLAPPPSRPQTRPIAKPAMLSEFVFHSEYLDEPYEMLESDVKAFIASAWRIRSSGRGLSERRWVRHWKQRSLWYKYLGPPFYYAFAHALREAQRVSQRHLVVKVGHQQYALRYDPHGTLAILKWAEYEKRKNYGT